MKSFKNQDGTRTCLHRMEC
ncbi:hypothetical protein RSAG8_03870, partial [Rhizoctonia solani AG-8 WAC10335]